MSEGRKFTLAPGNRQIPLQLPKFDANAARIAYDVFCVVNSNRMFIRDGIFFPILPRVASWGSMQERSDSYDADLGLRLNVAPNLLYRYKGRHQVSHLYCRLNFFPQKLS